MDQVKEFLRQVVKYRFWISVSIASLLAIVAYFLGAGPVRKKAEEQTKVIDTANKDVKQYSAAGVPNDQYKPIVEEKTEVITKDVNTAWKTLYSRQAPLLNWPEIVQERFSKWGRKWPEEVAPSAVTLAIVDYMEAYPSYVTQVYNVFKPFNFETGDGIVSAPPKESLLRPTVFDTKNAANLPDLGKIWSAQERLWLQRTALEVIAQVNKNAKNWDTAIIKQINALEVGNNLSQDQRSIAKGETLEEAEKISEPGTETEEADAGGGGGAMMGGMGGRMGREMMDSMMGMRGMMGGGGSNESVLFVKSEEDKGQYKVLPIMLTVLIDQNHIQDLLIELENSPMSVEVRDFELQRPSARVTKPEKGTNMNMGYGGMMGMMGGRMGREMMGGMYGGMMGQGRMSGYGGMMSGMMRGMMGGMGRGEDMGMMGTMGGPTRQGTSVRGVDRAKKREEQEKAVSEAKGPSLFDPFYNIVEVTVYGQARFYNMPAEEEKAESQGDAAEGADAKNADPSKAAKASADGKTQDTKAGDAPKAATAKDAAK